jgi:hypothetical protein
LLVDYPFLYNLLDMGIELKGLASQKQQSEWRHNKSNIAWLKNGEWL